MNPATHAVTLAYQQAAETMPDHRNWSLSELEEENQEAVAGCHLCPPLPMSIKKILNCLKITIVFRLNQLHVSVFSI